MNVSNNKRRRESQRMIEDALIQLVKNYNGKKISVTDICNVAKVNRTTFYANYLDLEDLIDKITQRESEKNLALFTDFFNGDDKAFLKYFNWIYDNQQFFKNYIALGFNRNYYLLNSSEVLKEIKEIGEYKLEFFQSGFSSIVVKWLKRDCEETPEEMCEILKDILKFEIKNYSN